MIRNEPRDDEATVFADRVAATAIVNQAVLKCLLRGLPITADNITLLVGDFFDPTKARYSGVVGEIMWAIDDMTQNFPSYLSDLNH